MPQLFKGAARANQKLGYKDSAPPPLGSNSPRCCPHWLPQVPRRPELLQLSPAPSLTLGDPLPPVLLFHVPSLSPVTATSQPNLLSPHPYPGTSFWRNPV